MSGYLVNEVFYSLQGEGARVGLPSVFVRFSKCNMRCSLEPGPRSPGGFDCDTEFETGRRLTAGEIVDACRAEVAAAGCEEPAGLMVILTGGEPALQVDLELVNALRDARFSIGVETNGSIELSRVPVVEGQPGAGLPDYPFDHIVVSPKVADHAIRQRFAHELRLVRAHGQELPETYAHPVSANVYMVSPAFAGDVVDPRALAWCVGLVLRHPQWRLSIQSHKLLRVR